jgi:methanogenic corrinoid protein MtbC1
MREKDELLKLRETVISCDDDDEMIQLTKNVLGKNIDPGKISKKITEAITIVGEKFEKGDLFLPELVIAGNGVMKAMTLINEALLKKNIKPIAPQGKVVIGTVEGDMHNIGKDIVVALLTAAGFEVHNLGVNVPASHFFSAAETMKANIVGISALMTTTMGEQKKITELFEEKGKREKYKILVGGGAVNQAWADQISADGYADNAAEAIILAKEVLNMST